MKNVGVAALAFCLASFGAAANENNSPAQEALIQKLRSEWRARSGETADEIVAKVRREAHFIPVAWLSDSSDGKPEVALSWKKRASDGDDETYSITWAQRADGHFEATDGLAEIELGSDAFATSLIQQDINDEVPDANRSFPFKLEHYGFLKLPHGTLATALSADRCTIKNPAYVYYVIPGLHDLSADTFFVSLTVDCATVGDALFTHDGFVQFRMAKHDKRWQPVSFLAERLSSGRSLNDALSDVEKRTILLVRDQVAEGKADNVIRFIEMRRTKIDSLSNAAAIRSNVDLVSRIGVEHPRATPSELAAFLRGAGAMAHTLSDEGISHMAAVF